MRNRLLAILAVLILGVAALYISAPRFDRIFELAMGSDQILLDRDGNLLQTLRTDFKKRRLAWQPLSSYPAHLQAAVIAAEDQRFYYHLGIDPWSLGRAMTANLRGGRVQGASTIPLQVSDLIQPDVLTGSESVQKGQWGHKFLQIIRGFALSIRWTKSEILEAYLNLVHLRGEFQGVSTASYAFLDKDPLALDPAESIVIATMISAPNQKQQTLTDRSCALLRRMNDATSDCSAVANAAAKFFAKPPELPTKLGTAPHLARRLFQEIPGKSIVKSSLDSKLQKSVVGILEKNIGRLASSNVNDMAAIVIENTTGKVLAYVGAVSTSKSPHVDGVVSYRQAGSSLKPFIYGKGIDRKLLTATSILLDEPTAISWGSQVYRPTNYDRHFFGPVTLREALGSSLNVPAVKSVLVIGLHETYKLFQDLRFTNLQPPDFYGVSMALGAVEVRLDELANAYRMLSQAGEWSALRFSEDALVGTNPRSRVFSPEASFVISDIISDPNARSIGFGWESPLETTFWTAVKTGTSKDYRDNWCVGFSSRYTVAVWAGNFDSQAMRKVSGVTGAGPAWYDIMNLLHGKEKSFPPKKPNGIVEKQVRLQWATNEHREYYLTGSEPVGNVIEAAPEKRPQFIFPAEGSILVKDPHLDQSLIAVSVRFSGTIPEKSELLMDGKVLGPAISPFRLKELRAGSHKLSIQSPEGKVLAQILFRVKGAN